MLLQPACRVARCDTEDAAPGRDGHNRRHCCLQAALPNPVAARLSGSASRDAILDGRRCHQRMPTLTEQQWKQVEPLLRNIDARRQAAAYNRLVKGMTLAAAGEPYGYSRQDVALIVKAVMRWRDKLAGLPDRPRPPRGWVAVEFIVPRHRVEDVRRVVEALYPQPRIGPDIASKESARSLVRPPRRPRQAASSPRATSGVAPDLREGARPTSKTQKR